MRKASRFSYRAITAFYYEYANADGIVHLGGWHTTPSGKLPPYWSVDANDWVDRDLRLLLPSSSLIINLSRKKSLREDQSYSA